MALTAARDNGVVAPCCHACFLRKADNADLTSRNPAFLDGPAASKA